MTFPGKYFALFPAIVFISLSSEKLFAGACTFYVSNKCPFPIWPATASNVGHPVVADGGFHLPPGRARRFQAPADWSGRIWARTGCDFTSTNHKPACETGDCDGRLECNGATGLPPATLVEFTLQADRRKPSFYDVSLVDGYNLPVQVETTAAAGDRGCRIGGCRKDLKSTCPPELRVVNRRGEVVACRSACLAFDHDAFCCRNAYGSPDTCRPSVYSKVFKDACPSYFSYAFDEPPPLVSCAADEYVVTFCPQRWGDGVRMSD
ncbi:pathogenesis-related thaumatin-like protein 3.5 [Andrographis paniculata]|uniref:pathogenesis-related thaumatin-like protein 3.5 n=1 Tax=Andrographis paniculata TaxID=175694 RepID=UPI0021E96EBD|nr:pathogenesis-related thaumatin-like protein 3.5 [Andrographis paniculata]